MIEKIPKDDGNVEWLMQPKHALETTSLSHVVKILVNKIDELVEEVNGLSEGES